jgi:hypothetical protein
MHGAAALFDHAIAIGAAKNVGLKKNSKGFKNSLKNVKNKKNRKDRTARRSDSAEWRPAAWAWAQRWDKLHAALQMARLPCPQFRGEP